jgi:hypothetical protein
MEGEMDSGEPARAREALLGIFPNFRGRAAPVHVKTQSRVDRRGVADLRKYERFNPEARLPQVYLFSYRPRACAARRAAATALSMRWCLREAEGEGGNLGKSRRFRVKTA